jgi:tetratricopeptide (TPR) repeat protein
MLIKIMKGKKKMKKLTVVLFALMISAMLIQSCAPTNPHLTEAKISMNRDDLQKAQKELALVLEQQPDNIEAAYLEGYIHFKQENWARMHESFDKVRSLDPEYEKANRDNMSLKAFGILRSAAINDKFNSAVKLITEETEKAELIMQSALKDLELADKLKSDDFITKDIIAMILLQLGKKDEAIAAFEEAIKYGKVETDGKNMVAAYINLFNLYSEKENEPKALEMLNKVLESDPANKEALLSMAKYHESKKEFDKALPLYEKMLEAEPDNVDILFNQGVMFKKVENIDKAIQNFERIIGINPNDGEAVYFLAEFYSQKGDFQKVVDLIEPKYDMLSSEWQEKVSDNIQIALVKVGRAKDAKKYQQQ